METKTLESFHQGKRYTGGRVGVCKACKYEQRKTWYQSKVGYYRSLRCIREYGITLEQKEKIRLDQGKKCAICKKEITLSQSKVDHNHITRKVRGILCNNCNTGIGHLKEDVKILKEAILYLMG